MRAVKILSLAVTVLLAAALAFGTPVPADDAVQAKRLAKGKDLIDGICFWCHEPELMETQHLNKKDWGDLIRPMIREGAPVTDEEFEMIVEYLSTKFGPEPQEDNK